MRTTRCTAPVAPAAAVRTRVGSVGVPDAADARQNAPHTPTRNARAVLRRMGGRQSKSRTLADLVLLQPIAQRVARETEQRGGARSIAARALERLPDQVALERLEGDAARRKLEG